MTNSDHPTNLLWAHEIRRENIHLVNELDTTKATLATTTTTLNALQQTVSSLEATVQTLTAPAANANANPNTGTSSRSGASETSEINISDELETRITELEGGINARIGEVVKRIEGVERENRSEKRRNWDWDSAKMREEVERCVEGRWARIMDEDVRGFVRDVVCQEMQSLLPGNGGVEAQRGQFGLLALGLYQFIDSNWRGVEKPNPEPELVPDSMPTGQTSPSPLKNENERTLSQSTLGTTATWSTPRDSKNEQQPDVTRENDESKNRKQSIPNAEEYGYENIRQNGRGLLEYLNFAEVERSQLPPRKREGGIVEVFVGGLDDTETKSYLEKRLDEDGWAWNALGVLVQKIAKGLDTPKKRNRVEDEREVKRKSKKRRYIPIVPVDEDDFV